MYKTKLQELCQRKRWELPVYTTGKNSPSHVRRFTSTVTVQGQVFETPAEFKSAKEAQNTAARMAFDHFTVPSPVDAVNSQFQAGAPPPPPVPVGQSVMLLPLSPPPCSLPNPPPGLLRKKNDANTNPATGEVTLDNSADTQTPTPVDNMIIDSHDKGYKDSRIEVLETRTATLEKGLENLDTKVTTVASDLRAQISDLQSMIQQMLCEQGSATDASSSAAPATPIDVSTNTVCSAVLPPNPMKLELPTFMGVNPSSWISRVEQYFRVDNTSEEMKVELALVAMEGTTLQWLLTRFPRIGWRKFIVELLRRYEDDQRANPYETLAATRQTATVDEYIDLFISRLSSVTNISDSFTLGLFLHGLHDDIRFRICSKDAEEISAAMHLACEIERLLNVLQPSRTPISLSRPLNPHTDSGFSTGRSTSLPNQNRSGGNFNHGSSPQQSSRKSSHSMGSVSPQTQSQTLTRSSAPARNLPFTQMSHSDYMDLRSKGLCYCCRELYSPTHKCASRSLRVMLIDDDEDEDPIAVNPPPTPVDKSHSLPVCLGDGKDTDTAGLLREKIEADTKPANGAVMQDNSADSHEKGCKARLSMYKNQLQQYAQKEDLGFPVYSTEAQGPPRDRRFKSRVCVAGKSYETTEFFTTLKEAEQAVAKVACQALSVDVIQKDGGLYKTLLQEFAQKKGLLRPSYETVSSGMSHQPVFVSVVAVGTNTFRGAEAKTKKQAEVNAAKVAYFDLTKGW